MTHFQEKFYFFRNSKFLIPQFHAKLICCFSLKIVNFDRSLPFLERKGLNFKKNAIAYRLFEIEYFDPSVACKIGYFRSKTVIFDRN